MRNWEFYEILAKQSDEQIIQAGEALDDGNDAAAIVQAINSTTIMLQTIAASLASIADHMEDVEKEAES